MSRRESIYVSRKLRTPYTPPPNTCFPQVTTEIRVFAPAITPVSILTYELSLATIEATSRMEAWPGPKVARTPDQLTSELAAYGIVVPPAWHDSALWPAGEAPSS